MAELKLFLLGHPQVELNGDPLTINRRKVLALLAYLATRRRAQPRDHLATLLWPGYDQSSGRANLRKTVSLLKQQVGGDWLDIQREQIGLVRGDNFWLDLDLFRRLVNGCISPGRTAGEVTPSCMDALNQAVDLYRDDFLTGFSLPDSPEFTDWQLFQAEYYRRRLAQLYATLSRGYANQKEWDTAVDFARRWLSLDELEESAHRQLMRLLAWKGQRNAALVQYAQCCQILAEELAVEPADETTALYEKIRQGTLCQEETVALAPAPPNNLPPQLTTFVGRQDEVAEITHLLGEVSSCRHLTLFGPGGIGKTRLAIKAATIVGEIFPDGVTMVSLVALNHPDSIVPTIADALGLDVSRGNLQNRLLEYLRHRRLLLILDNFEHLISPQATGLLAEILLHAPSVKLLVTSRHRLNMEQEWSVEVFGMRLPPAGEMATTAIDDYDAVQLFLQRAQRLRHDFDLSNENRADVVRICRLVDGIPLGIELAVAWLRYISCREIAKEIERSLDFLTSSYPDVPDRHHSLRAVFDYSWQLLSEEEKGGLRRLSVFRGGFTGRAAQRVAGANLPRLVLLMDKALLHRSASRRYQMHVLLRQFAAGKLDEVPHEKEQTQDRHATFYLALVQQRRGNELDVTGKETLEAFVADVENVWAAWNHALSRGQYELLARSADGLYYLSYRTGRLQEGGKSLQKALQEAPQTVGALTLGRLMRGFGAIRFWMGDLAQGSESLEQSVSLLRQVGSGSQIDLAHSLYELSHAYWLQGMYAQTEGCAQESLSLYTACQDPYRMGLAAQVLGMLATYTGNYRKGIELLETSVDLLQLRESSLGIRGAYSRLFLGIIARLRGEYGEAKSILEALLQALRDAGNPLDIGYALRELGYLNICLGDYAQARFQMEEGAKIFKESGARGAFLLLATGLGYIARLMGEHGRAERLHQEALATGREIGERRGVAICLENLGRLAYDQGAYRQAEDRFRESLKRYEEMGHPHGQATVLCQLGITALSLGEERRKEAEHRLHQALRISTEIGATPLILEALRGYALLWTTRETGQICHEKTLELLSLIRNHPASEQETKDHARRLGDKLAAGLPAELVASALNRGPGKDVESIAKEIMFQNPL